MLSLLFLAAIPAAGALHISEHTDTPNILTVPELQIPNPGYAKLAELPAGDLFGLQHSFLGVTDVGFIDFKYNSVPKTSSIHAAHYDDVLSTASIVCAPVTEGEAPTLAEGKHVRNDITVAIAFTSAAMALPDYAHFVERTQAEGAYLTFDHSVHATYAAFGPGTPCAVQIPHEASVYAIDSAVVEGASLTLTLTPASVRDAHHMLDVQFFWDPDTGREVSRRRALGLDTGVDARRRLRGRAMPAVPMTGSTSISMNYNNNAAAPAATTDVIEFLPSQAGALTCKGCYAFVQATYSINFQFCVGFYAATGQIWLFTSQKFDGSMGAGIWSTSPGWTPTTTAENLADCSAALAPWIAVSGTGSSPVINLGGAALSTNLNGNAFTTPNALRSGYTGLTFNAAFNIDASVGGTAGFNFQLTSTGITSAGNTPSCTGTDSSLCQANAVSIVSATTPFAITIATGVTATISAKVQGAAIWSGALPWTLSVGAKAAVGSTATPVKLGGRLMIADLVGAATSCASGTPASCLTALSSAPNAITPYTTFPLTYGATPLSITLTANPSASLDATIWTTTTILVDDAIPISVSSAMQFKGALAAGTSRRSLGYYEPAARMLDSAATCPKAGSYVTLTANALMGATAGPATLAAVINGALPGVVPSAAQALLPPGNLIPTLTISAQAANPNGASQPLVAACVALNAPLTGKAGGAGATAITSTGGGGGSTSTGGGGGSLSGGSAADIAAAAAAAGYISIAEYRAQGLGLGLGLGLGWPILICSVLVYFYGLPKGLRSIMVRPAAPNLTKQPEAGPQAGGTAPTASK